MFFLLSVSQVQDTVLGEGTRDLLVPERGRLAEKIPIPRLGTRGLTKVRTRSELERQLPVPATSSANTRYQLPEVYL